MLLDFIKNLRWRNVPFAGRRVCLLLAWSLALAGGFGFLLRYESRSAPLAGPVPSMNASFRDEKHLSLLLALHPHCPCSRATVGELEKIYSLAPRDLKITVLAFKPADEPDSWIQSPTVRALSKMEPRMVIDSDGEAARRFGLNTSGQVQLYDHDGKLLYNGGITGGRGHSGDNAGEDTVLRLIRDSTLDLKSSPTFGCSLFE